LTLDKNTNKNIWPETRLTQHVYISDKRSISLTV